jgi:hypothetical protein
MSFGKLMSGQDRKALGHYADPGYSAWPLHVLRTIVANFNTRCPYPYERIPELTQARER